MWKSILCQISEKIQIIHRDNCVCIINGSTRCELCDVDSEYVGAATFNAGAYSSYINYTRI